MNKSEDELWRGMHHYLDQLIRTECAVLAVCQTIRGISEVRGSADAGVQVETELPNLGGWETVERRGEKADIFIPETFSSVIQGHSCPRKRGHTNQTSPEM